VDIIKDSFIGDGTTTTFLMSQEYEVTNNETMVLVFVGNVFQESGESYQVSGFNLTFDEAPPLNSRVVVLHNFNSIHSVN